MKKILYLILISFVVSGCERSDSPKLNYNSITLENSLLWQISGNGLKAPSYLFGTEHLIGASFLDSLPYVMIRFKQCKAVAGEIRIDSNTRKQNTVTFLKDDSLSNLFNPHEFKTIDSLLTRYSRLKLTKLNKLTPFIVNYVLMKSIAPHTANKTNPSLDEFFQTAARSNNYGIVGLDTKSFDDSLISNIPIDVQKKQLLFLVNNINYARQIFTSNFNSYRQQNLNSLEQTALSVSEIPTEELGHFVKDRNDKWLNELPHIMKQQPTFIAVGAAHLLWDCGLINQLRLKGYTVKPVKN
jgi:uncharacterized protein YbaP (TraB family)